MARQIKKCPPVFEALIHYILTNLPGLNTIALMKTAYLVELEYKRVFGQKLTEIQIVRLPKGPAYTGERNLLDRLNYHNILVEKKEGKASLFYANPKYKTNVVFTELEIQTINNILNRVKMLKKMHPLRYSVLLKELSYNTLPMQIIQNQEKHINKLLLGKNLLKAPYFTIKKDADSNYKDNQKKRDIQKMEMATKLLPEEKERLQNKLSMLKAKLADHLNKKHYAEPEISEEEKQEIHSLIMVQQKALESVMRG
ncbi:MAG: hypothetical protein Kow0037_00860 [Calditrichia bacterium]